MREIIKLIDFHGSIPAAIESLEARIARRKAEGKTSPVAEYQIRRLNRIWDRTGGAYMTPKQRKSQKGWAESGGFAVG